MTKILLLKNTNMAAISLTANAPYIEKMRFFNKLNLSIIPSTIVLHPETALTVCFVVPIRVSSSLSLPFIPLKFVWPSSFNVRNVTSLRARLWRCLDCINVLLTRASFQDKTQKPNTLSTIWLLVSATDSSTVFSREVGREGMRNLLPSERAPYVASPWTTHSNS